MSVRTVPGALDILNQKLGGNAGDIPASSTKEYALEKIYRSLGGEESLEGVNTTSEIIEKIAGVAQGGGGETWQTIFEGQATTTKPTEDAPLAAGPLEVGLSADTIKVTFNGEEFTVNKQIAVNKQIDGEIVYYGEIDANNTPVFDTYPFFISNVNSGMESSLVTPEAGTYSLKIEELGQGGASDFSTAEVTMTEDKNSNKTLWIPYIESNVLINGPLTDTDVKSVIVPLYKGVLKCGYTVAYAEESDIISGAVTIKDGLFIITGDCHIKCYKMK